MAVLALPPLDVVAVSLGHGEGQGCPAARQTGWRGTMRCCRPLFSGEIQKVSTQRLERS